MSAQQPLLEGGRPPINKLRVAAIISAGVIGVINILTLAGVIPVEMGTQTGLCGSAVLPIILGLASLKSTKTSPLFEEASKMVVPGGSVRKVTHSNLTGQTIVEYGKWTDKDRKRMDDL